MVCEAPSAESLEWLAFDPGFDHGSVTKYAPNVQGTFGEQPCDYGKTDVRERNVTGQVGDPQFNQLVAKTQTAMTPLQLCWRAAVVGLALVPIVGLKPLATLAADPSQSWPSRVLFALVMIACLVPLRFLAKQVLMVKQGEICFVQLMEDGTTQILLAGIHLLPCLGSTTKSFPVTADEMRYGTLVLIRVRSGFIGLGTDNGKPVLLLPGMHLYNAPNFEYSGPTSVNDNLIKNGTVNIIRVQPGQVGLATVNGTPIMLESGVHFIDEASFVMERGCFKKVDEALIQLGQMQIVVVPRGKIAPVLVNGEGHFLLEGRHFVSQGRFSYQGLQSLSDEYACAGTRHRILVPSGRIGLGLEAGEPLLLEAGQVHLRNSALFQYKGSVDITQQVISHGSLNIVTVRDGQFGISYKDGVIKLLDPGRHTLDSATHVPGGFISAGQQTLRISEVTGMSSDNVELRFDAAICLRVVDPQKAVVMLTQGKRDRMEELQANVQERAKLALSIIIGNNNLNRKHGATLLVEQPAREEEQQEEGFVEVPEKSKEDEANSFRQYIHDIFMHSFSVSMLNECGIQVIDMSIEDVVIVNTELATAMASAAVANSSLEKSTIEAEIVQVKATAESKVALIEARGKAAAMEITSKADADRIKTVSDALHSACPSAQQMELIRASGCAVSQGSTVMLAQDMSALATLLGGAQGAALGPKLK